MQKAKISLVGFGPGSREDMSFRAAAAICGADLVIGYTSYIRLLEELFPGLRTLATGMTREIERCELAVEKALEGCSIALVSSGDAGIYGMAGILLEVLERRGLLDKLPCEIIPGITAAQSAAARLGAPLMNDFACISLSDHLTEKEQIFRRLRACAEADMVICLYNPRSKARPQILAEAAEEIMNFRPAQTPVGIVSSAGRKGENICLSTLEKLADEEVGMLSTVIVGNSYSTILEREAGTAYLLTRRGYQKKSAWEELPEENLKKQAQQALPSED